MKVTGDLTEESQFYFQNSKNLYAIIIPILIVRQFLAKHQPRLQFNIVENNEMKEECWKKTEFGKQGD